MKRMKKAIVGLAVGAIAALGVVGFAACGEKAETYDGDYHYTTSGYGDPVTYGIKVKVTVKDGKIEKVEVVNSDYVDATDMGVDEDGNPVIVGGWDNGANWDKELKNELAKFKGLSVSDVLALNVAKNDAGEPLKSTDDGFNALNVGGKNLILTGSTQSSGRLILAVQDALKDLK